MKDLYTTDYEWMVEAFDEDGDIVWLDHFPNSLEEARACAATIEDQDMSARIALVLSVYAEDGETLIDRQHAYLSPKGRLPATFEYGTSIPKRYRAEARQVKP